MADSRHLVTAAISNNSATV